MLVRTHGPVLGPRLPLGLPVLVMAAPVRAVVVALADPRPAVPPLVALVREPERAALVLVPSLVPVEAVPRRQVAPAAAVPHNQPEVGALPLVADGPEVPEAVLPVVVPAQRVAVSAPAVAVDAAPAREPRDDYRHELFRSHSPHRCR